MKTFMYIAAVSGSLVLASGLYAQPGRGGPPGRAAVEPAPHVATASDAVLPRSGERDRRQPLALQGSGHLALEFSSGCMFTPGDSITVWLTVSALEGPVNGVQALISFDPNALQVQSVLPGDGLGSPWDAALVVASEIGPTTITYAAGLPGATDLQDAVVARMQLLFDPNADPPAGQVRLEPSLGSLETLLIDGITGTAFAPMLGGPLGIASFADANADGFVDAADWLVLQDCLAGPDVAAGGEPCCRFDGEPDGDVDLADLAAVQLVFGGVEVRSR